MRAELLAWMALRPPMTASQMIEAGVLEELAISGRENLVTCLCEMCKSDTCPVSAVKAPETHLYQGRSPRRGWVNVYRIRGVHHD
ncbi:hypothetical protein [Aeromonas veronii]|uniref:hypothetical protein n=1 Tax=Aeromonas veronii TaxID=654 RepID=UPI001302709F|nr:hypothetical protein [Aeromonas veronii]KAE9627485.1 hypothetical protein GO977_22020 [Aeromonas veronii]